MPFISTQSLLVVAVLAALLSAVLFLVFVRPAAQRSEQGIVIDKTFEDERTITHMNAGPRREFWSTNRFKIPAGYLFTIRLNSGRGEVYYLLERTAGEPFQVGQRVTVTYDERGISPLWKKRYVRCLAAVAQE